MPFHPRFSFIYFFQFLIIPVEEGGEGGKMMKGEQGHKKKNQNKKRPTACCVIKKCLVLPGSFSICFRWASQEDLAIMKEFSEAITGKRKKGLLQTA